jgi:hypothetical protein
MQRQENLDVPAVQDLPAVPGRLAAHSHGCAQGKQVTKVFSTHPSDVPLLDKHNYLTRLTILAIYECRIYTAPYVML